MKKEAMDVIEGVVETTYNTLGYHFQTPEAWDENGRYRAHTYMRPLCIWAVQYALEQEKQKSKK